MTPPARLARAARGPFAYARGAVLCRLTRSPVRLAAVALLSLGGCLVSVHYDKVDELPADCPAAGGGGVADGPCGGGGSGATGGGGGATGGGGGS